jgi:glycopeptide antibiotics resistance protein
VVLELGDVALNILMFIPLGVVMTLAPRSVPKAALLCGALALPFIIEVTQLFVTPLDRACQSADVIDNETGLAIGVIVGGILSIIRMGPQRTDEDMPAP